MADGRMKMKKALALALAFLTAINLAACGSWAKPGRHPQQESFETVSLKVGYMPNIGSASLAVTAKEMGYFEEMGLDVKLVEYETGPQEIEAMEKGELDICQIGPGAHSLCIEGRAKVFYLDNISLADAVIANKEKGIETAAQLKGKRVACSPGTTTDILLELALETANLSLADVVLVPMNVSEMPAAMADGSVDACAAWSPQTIEIRKLLEQNAVTIANNNDFVNQVTFPASFAAGEGFCDQNKDVLVRFSRALLKGQNYRAANIRKVARMVAEQCDLEPQVVLDTIGRGEWLTGEFMINGLADGTVKSYYQNQQSVFIDTGILKKAVPVSNYVRLDIMEAAAAAAVDGFKTKENQ